MDLKSRQPGVAIAAPEPRAFGKNRSKGFWCSTWRGARARSRLYAPVSRPTMGYAEKVRFQLLSLRHYISRYKDIFYFDR